MNPNLRNMLVSLAGLAAAEAAAQPRKPLIGINMDIPTSATTATGLALRSTYVDAVSVAGGLPIVLPPVLDPADIARYVELADGFIFVGGRDLNPALFNREKHEATNLLNERREKFDFLLMELVLQSGKPMLCVCLGVQELNVFHGGTIIQDIPTEAASSINHRPEDQYSEITHEVRIKEGTLLHSLIGTTKLGVNSIHHQACEAPGSNLIISAQSPDGIIEALEISGHRFAIGVQWHPEYLPQHDPHVGLFRGLVEASREGTTAKVE